MKCNRHWFCVALLLALAAQATFAEWSAIEEMEFESSSGKYALKISPDESKEYRPGHCKAVLFKADDKNKTMVWSRYLINNDGPVEVYVSNSGQYVVTMDEWANIGELPLVIYGNRGKLIKVHSVESLGLEEDWEHLEVGEHGNAWSENSISFFGPEEEVFIVRLRWGKILFLSLVGGGLMDEEWYDAHKGWFMPEKKWKALHQYVPGQIKKQALLLLHSNKAEDRKTGALVCQQEKIESASLRLKELLKDKEYFTTNDPKEGTRVYYVRKAAKQALEALGQKVDGVVIEEPDER